MALPVAILQHLPTPFTGYAGEALRAAALELDERHVANGDPLPALDEVSALIALGGYESVTEIERYPYLVAEAALLREAVEAGVPVLGICLGGQLLAHALGAGVRRLGAAKPTWPQVQRVGADPVFDALPATLHTLHWNEDGFDLPDGAVELLSRSAATVEAFRFGDRAWGTQFHPEIDPPAMDALLERAAGKVDEPAVRAAAAARWDEQRANGLALFGAFAACARASGPVTA